MAARSRGKSRKRPRHQIEPNPTKTPRGQPDTPGRIRFSLAIFDPYLGEDSDQPNSHGDASFVYVAERLSEQEKRPWVEIESNRWRDHPVAVSHLIRNARARLNELKQDDVDELWRLRFAAKERLWGIRVGDVFRVLWWDPHHVVAPSTLKHT